MALQMQQRLACHIADLRAYERVQWFCALLEGGHPVDFATRVDSGQLVPERLVRLECLIPVGHRHLHLRCAGSRPSRTIERRILAKRSKKIAGEYICLCGKLCAWIPHIRPSSLGN